MEQNITGDVVLFSRLSNLFWGGGGGCIVSEVLNLGLKSKPTN